MQNQIELREHAKGSFKTKSKTRQRMCVDMKLQQENGRQRQERLRRTGQSEMPVSALCSAALTAVRKIQVDT